MNNCLEAIDLIGRIPGCRVEAKSRFYLTEPVDIEGQDQYVNGAVSLSADISAQDLLARLLAIEESMGRERKRKWDSRVIDLDILLFARDVISEKNLTVPHPLMHLRRFVLVPMVQLDPDLTHPCLGKTMHELLDNLSEEGQAVIPLGEV